MENVTVYTKSYCPYCTSAKQLLTKRGIAFSEIKLEEQDEKAFVDLCNRSGMRTVPQIFKGETLIGGYSELAKLDSQDSLVSLK